MCFAILKKRSVASINKVDRVAYKNKTSFYITIPNITKIATKLYDIYSIYAEKPYNKLTKGLQ
jgi:hypothetical protein